MRDRHGFVPVLRVKPQQLGIRVPTHQLFECELDVYAGAQRKSAAGGHQLVQRRAKMLLQRRFC
jgi:hypothetical protein